MKLYRYRRMDSKGLARIGQNVSEIQNELTEISPFWNIGH